MDIAERPLRLVYLQCPDEHEGVMRFAEHLDLTGSQSPQGVGRVVAALAEDENIMSRNGRALLVDDLAQLYGIDVTT